MNVHLSNEDQARLHRDAERRDKLTEQHAGDLIRDGLPPERRDVPRPERRDEPRPRHQDPR